LKKYRLIKVWLAIPGLPPKFYPLKLRQRKTGMLSVDEF